MSSKQTRKSISVSGELYQAIRAQAQVECTTGSGLVEKAMRHRLGMEPRQMKGPSPRKAEVIGDPIDVPVTPKPTAPQPEAVETITTKAEVSVSLSSAPSVIPGAKPDRISKFKEWDEKQRTKAEPKNRDGSNIFTF